ncbi:hypothetical protein GE061_010595 [Apolygus lucorum]|uniref:Reverse transcriptase domain-containing protein n=1 Tax=Apolygus lucorum TaxID=248454 RepID=A0A8S9XZ49_APOLU|nr:hypothetical protein GE061_010595 [Apolygus lucorum]
MLREAPESYLEGLLALYNHALEDGIFPAQWKIARIKAILKSPNRNPSLISSLRPVSLLPCKGKLLERLILNVIEPQLSLATHPNQFGCTRGRCTEVQLHSCLARHAHPSKELLYRPFAELSTKNRTPRIGVTRGCPQGSVLGTAFWNLAFSGLLLELDSEEAVVLEAQTRAELVLKAEKVSRRIQEWCTFAILELSAGKTQSVLFRGSEDHQHPFRFTAGNGRLQAKEVVRYLGIELSRKHSCSPQLENVASKSTRIAPAVRGLSGSDWGIPYACHLKYIQSVFLSSVMYGASTWWNNPTKAQRERVLRIQRACLIAMTKAYETCSTDALLVLSGTMPLDLMLDARVALVTVKSPSRVCVPIQPDLKILLESCESIQEKRDAIRQWATTCWQEQ